MASTFSLQILVAPAIKSLPSAAVSLVIWSSSVKTIILPRSQRRPYSQLRVGTSQAINWLRHQSTTAYRPSFDLHHSRSSLFPRVLPSQISRGLHSTPLSKLDSDATNRSLVVSSFGLTSQWNTTAASYVATRNPSLGLFPRSMLHSLIKAPLQSGPSNWIQNYFQRRLMSTNNHVSLETLSVREAAANRNPENSSAQAAFYQVLLKANFPKIVIQRYESGRYASSIAATAAYNQALSMLSARSEGAPPHNVPLPLNSLPANNWSSPGQSPDMAAKLAATTALGTKSNPVMVSVSDSLKGIVSSWIKFVLVFATVCYFSIVILALAVEIISQPGPQRSLQIGSKQPKPTTEKTVKFENVAGVEEAKEELMDLVEFLKNPGKFSTLGGKLPKGVLLVGPPGTGKTLLARAVAGEAGVPFFYMSGSEFEEVFVGVGAKRIRDLFSSAKAKSPAIVFIDEIDAIGGRRSSRDAIYNRQTLNQLLNELDGFEQNSGVVVIAATNFADVLDPALVRPGRFDRIVNVDLPDIRGRTAILKQHSKKVRMDPKVVLEKIAALTPGFSGADLAELLNSAAVHASKINAVQVENVHLEWAIDKIHMGAERKTLMMTPLDKEMTAYHEAGHALVSLSNQLPESMQLNKVTILPRGQSLGATYRVYRQDQLNMTYRSILADIEVNLGGKMAEELVYGAERTTSGCASDLETATKLAFFGVTRLGMSSKLGNLDYGGDRYQLLSSETKALIETEARNIISSANERVRETLKVRRTELDRLAEALMQYETLNREEVLTVIGGGKLPDRIEIPRDSPIIVPLGTRPFDGGLPDLDEPGKNPPHPGGIVTGPK